MSDQLLEGELPQGEHIIECDSCGRYLRITLSPAAAVFTTGGGVTWCDVCHGLLFALVTGEDLILWAGGVEDLKKALPL